VMVVAWATKKITSRSMKDMETNGWRFSNSKKQET
jgi:hypothetical protein